MFCAHAIRMRDTRCCSITLRLFVSLVPEFAGTESGQGRNKLPHGSQEGQAGEAAMPSDKSLIPEGTCTAIREFISLDVLKACITSFHEPYFVEVQKDLAMLIAAIVVFYSPTTKTPKEVLQSLPNIQPSELERLAPYMAKPGSHTRQQRAVVMDLLKDLKGVSVSEMGKMPSSTVFGPSGGRTKRHHRSKMAQEFMSAAPEGNGAMGGDRAPRERRATPDGLEGVSILFDG